MKKVIFVFIILFIFSGFGFSQKEDPVLFMVNNDPVHVSEFLYIYKKNNGKKADFSKKSLKEYLDLYTKFKLKVTKARAMQLDTIPELINELAGYRTQLAKSYLVDKEVNEKLIREVFDRKQKDLDVSHILISNDNVADLERNAAAKAKIFFMKNHLEKGVPFEELARKHSDDKSSTENGGKLGFVTAMLPNGFYEFENQIYNLNIGEYSEPFKTDYGYHIVKLNGERPGRGEMEAAHIMIRKKNKGKTDAESQALIDSLYDRILAGESFEELAKNFSMDKKSSAKGGYIGVFGINRYEKSFEDAVFKLERDGDISQPISTSVGWHIVKRISKPDWNNYDKAKRSIGAEITKDSRFKIGKKVLVDKIKREANFKEDSAALNHFNTLLDPSFFTLYWEYPKSLDRFLFSLGNRKFHLFDFASYLKKKQRERIRYGKETAINLVVNKMYEDFVAEKCIAYEEDILEEKYPDFKSLMREYDEGILLFEATKREVWDKASRDTVGLKQFYANHKDQYLFKSRADLYTYTIHTDDEALTKKIYKYAKKKNHDKLIKAFNKESQLITFSHDKYEMGHKELSDLKWKKKALSEITFHKGKGSSTFKKIAGILPESPKTLMEARGYVIADYQEYLEKNWVDSLKEEFKVEIREDVFHNLIKD